MFYTSLCSVFLKVNRMIILFGHNNDILILFHLLENHVYVWGWVNCLGRRQTHITAVHQAVKDQSFCGQYTPGPGLNVKTSGANVWSKL
jgi:hypothetical protein